MMTLGELLDILNGIHGAFGAEGENLKVEIGRLGDEPAVEVIEHQHGYTVLLKEGN